MSRKSGWYALTLAIVFWVPIVWDALWVLFDDIGVDVWYKILYIVFTFLVWVPFAFLEGDEDE